MADEPIRRAGQLWSRAADGSWLLWNPARGTWESSSFGPPPPPPPGGQLGTPPIEARPRGRSQKDQVLVAVALILSVALTGLVVLYLPNAATTVTAATPPPLGGVPTSAATPDETSIYDIAPQLAGCVDNRLEDNLTLPTGFPQRFKEIAERVIALRELEFKRPVRTRFLSSAALSRRAGSEVAAAFDHRRADLQEKVLKLLGAIPKEMDLAATVQRLTEQQILGYYVPKSKTIFAPTARNEGDPLSEVTLAHELEHALIDQVVGLPKLGSRDPSKEETQYAARALIEGDATLLTQNYIYFGLSSEQRVQLGEDTSDLLQGLDEDVPYFVERSMSFPYSEGLLFACYLYQKGGWQAINDAYEHPPQSTVEILFPGRYGTVPPPKDPPDPHAPAGWTHVGRFALGAADLLFLFQTPPYTLTGFATPEDVWRVRRWSGGEIHAFERNGEFAIVASIDGSGVPQDGADRKWMCGEIQGWIETVSTDYFPLDGTTRFYERRDGSGAGVACKRFGPRFVIAPTKALARKFL